ncbi:hypothetical protein PHLGIDRAFT_506171 [Phlebiopsis gigantea 11061_1 CR5-6]|uniref:Uncharacterized protein n=1 Tax=Phlebiopsis gigantea (strain 11061_1 CR5-6) TaxID=745531 RepID=A0A0C3P9V0_PHLG1|nr:hypothetical protein PHLGIDRAFT_506171 [Phlebiopsis gigantea 11061_1 CR5-6]
MLPAARGDAVPSSLSMSPTTPVDSSTPTPDCPHAPTPGDAIATTPDETPPFDRGLEVDDEQTGMTNDAQQQNGQGRGGTLHGNAPTGVHYQQHSPRTKAKRDARKGLKAGPPTRWPGEQGKLLASFMSDYEAIDRDNRGKLKRLSDFWHKIEAAFWGRFTAQDVRDSGKYSGASDAVVIQKTNTAIKDWYRNNDGRVVTGPTNPWTKPLAALRKPQGRAPKQLPPWQYFAKVEADRITEESSNGRVWDRNRVAKGLFEGLPPEEQSKYSERAAKAHMDAMDEYNAALTGRPSAEPKDQKAAQERLAVVVKPLLETIAHYTGFHAVTLIGAQYIPEKQNFNIGVVNYGEAVTKIKYYNFYSRASVTNPDTRKADIPLNGVPEELERSSAADSAPSAGRFRSGDQTKHSGSQRRDPKGKRRAREADSEEEAEATDGGDGDDDDDDDGDDDDDEEGRGDERQCAGEFEEGGDKDVGEEQGEEDGEHDKTPAATETEAETETDSDPELPEPLRTAVNALGKRERRAEMRALKRMGSLELARENNIIRNKLLLGELGIEGPSTNSRKPQASKAKPDRQGPSAVPLRSSSRRTRGTAPLAPPPTAGHREPTVEPSGPSAAPPIHGSSLFPARMGSVGAVSSPVEPLVSGGLSLSSVPGPGAQASTQHPDTPNRDQAQTPSGQHAAAPSEVSGTQVAVPSIDLTDQNTPMTAHLSMAQAGSSSVDVSGCPEWLKTHYQRLRAIDMAEDQKVRWNHILASWVELERLLGYGGKPHSGLSTTHRPSEIRDWIQRARKAHVIPLSAASSHEYAEKWLKWWMAINPECRTVNGKLARAGSGDWSPLLKSGINGWLTVIVSMLSLRDGGAPGRDAWPTVLENVEWTINEVLNTQRVATSKRTNDGDASNGDASNSDQEDRGTAKRGRPARGNNGSRKCARNG